MKPSDLKTKLSQGEDVMIVDVREQDEYEQGEKMDGAQNIPMGRMFAKATKGDLPKDKKIVTVCSAGTRCEIVARELSKKGYDIDYLEGGLNAWKQA